MEGRKQNFLIGSKINTLEESLKRFGIPCSLEQLDMNLELVRRNKETKEKHLLLLKSIDKDLLKLSRTHHPDKAIGEKKLDEEVTDAQNLQIALNATRTVLKALAEEFLKDIDIHFKYEFFAKLDINTLINEKQIECEINNVLSKISHLSEVKRVNIVGEIRKFLQKSREALRNFLGDNNHDFVRHRNYAFHRGNKYDFIRHRDNALHHLHKCSEGYKILATECELLLQECSDDNDENTKKAIQKICNQSAVESEILQNLERVAKRSLKKTFEIFPIFKRKYHDSKKDVIYEAVVPEEREYLVSPFTLYVNVLLMCSAMVDEKTQVQNFLSNIGGTLECWFGNITEESADFINEPLLLKAYYLAYYYNNRNHYKEKVETILKEKNCYTTDSKIIREVFNEIVKEIEKLLDERFDINSYKEGKSNREQFNERLFELNDSMAEFKKEEKKLLEKFKLCEQESNEIQKQYLTLSGKHAKTGQGYRENPISEDEDNRKYVESVQNIKETEKTDRAKRFFECIPDCTQNVPNSMLPQSSSGYENGHSTVFQRDVGKITLKDTPQSIPNWLEVSGDIVMSAKSQLYSKANSASPEYISGCENSDQTTQVTNDQCHDFPKEYDESSKLHAGVIPCSRRDQLHKESLSNLMSKRFPNEQAKTEKIQPSIKAYIASTEYTNQTAKMAEYPRDDFTKQNDEGLNVHAGVIPWSNTDQFHKESLSDPMSKCFTNEQAETDKIQLNTKANITSTEYTNQIAKMTEYPRNDFTKQNNDGLNVHTDVIPCSSTDPFHKESLSDPLSKCFINEQAESGKIQLNTKANIISTKYTNQIAKMAEYPRYDFPKDNDDGLNVHADIIACSSRGQFLKESLSDPLFKRFTKEQAQTDKIQLNTKTNISFTENMSTGENANQTPKVAEYLLDEFLKENGEYRKKMHVKEIPCFSGDQVDKEPLGDLLSDCVSSEQNINLRRDLENFPRENEGK